MLVEPETILTKSKLGCGADRDTCVKRRVGDRIRAAAGFGDGEGWTAADTATAGWAAVGTATAGRFYEF